MVFKRVLKGIGRLMLTTAVMCGVGLFLCSSEVKAGLYDANVSLTSSTDTSTVDNRFSITVTNNNDNVSAIGDSIFVNKIELKDSADNVVASFSYDPAVEIKGKDTSTSDGKSEVFKISDSDFLKAVISADKVDPGNDITIKKAIVYYSKPDGSGGQGSPVTHPITSEAKSKPIYEVEITEKNDIPSDLVTSGINFSYKNETNNLVTPYGYAGDTITITNAPNDNTFSLDNYYRYCYNGSFSGTVPSLEWVEAKNSFSKEVIGGATGVNTQNEYNVTYLPKISDFKIKTATPPGTFNSTENRLDIVVGAADTVQLNVEYVINSLKQSNESQKDIAKYYCEVNIVKDNLTISDAGFSVPGKLTPEIKLDNPTKSGYAKVTINSKLNGTQVNIYPLEFEIYVGVKPTGIVFKNEPITIMAAGNEEQVPIVSGFSPSGANQDPKLYTLVSIKETSTPNLLEKLDYDQASGTVKVKAKSTAAGGKTTKVKLELKDGNGNLVQGEFNVKIISFDKEKTISSINKNNKNYITYNKDKGYSLDIKQLIIDNAKDTSDNAVTITKDQIRDVYVGSSSCTDGIWKPSEAALNQKVSCKINGVKIEESDGLKVSAYPMPTATYSSSNRTLSVKIPTKVATAYSDDNNIRQSKGFKLILEDSSGNTLYEYTDSKYQNVLSSSSESTVTYTVTAADIEGMITSAASNGKFSADTTSVKFKVIPMGYKQSSTSDETIKAKDEIAGKTDAVTVYKVSASGTNFTSSAAYGLDGQTVSITATPNSGYSFKQWSDGNTSNPRQVKVSASGTRSFQAVAGDRVANSTGAGGTDNSELYDDVPKTAESNSAIWLIVFMVFAVMGTTYALYLQLKAANSKHDR